jgi:hypothetical protein
MRLTTTTSLLLIILSCGSEFSNPDEMGQETAFESEVVEGVSAVTVALTHRLPGFSATVIAAGSGGELAVLSVGEKGIRKTVNTKSKVTPVRIRAHDSKFFALYESGSVAVINANTAAIEKTISTGVNAARDIEFGNDGSLFVSSAKSASVTRLDLASAKRSTVSLSNLAVDGGRVEINSLLCVNTLLFAQVHRIKNERPQRGALAVIDIASNTLKKVIELEGKSADGRTAMPGLKPSLPMAFDGTRNAIWVPLSGVRPSNTGMLLKVDVPTLAVSQTIPADSGFQGALVVSAKDAKMYVLYHTSTPTDSSHLFSSTFDRAGLPVQDGEETLIDAFDGIDAVAIDSSKRLVAMGNGCAAGFCIGGAGINFVNAETRAVLPKLMAAEIGFEPAMVVFQ